MKQPTDEDSRDYVTALARGLQVLQLCASATKGITLSEAALRTGLSRATVRRSLLTLTAEGYVVGSGRHFLLTPKVLSLGAGLSADSLPRLAQPVLDRLSRTFGESFSVATLEGAEILYVARSEARRIVALDLVVGSRLPAYCTSMGRVLLAALPVTAMTAHLPALLPRRTPRTITDPAKLLVSIAEVREAGFCILDQELELGLRSLAVPIRDSEGKTAGAINVSTQASRTTVRDLRRLMLPALQEAAVALQPLFLKAKA
jgi:IclR family pca regulon transcriptional regulator